MNRILILLFLLLLINSCSMTDSNEKFTLGSFMENFGIYADTDAKDESQFITVPFEKAMNRTLQKSLGTQKTHFVARYRGIVSQPEPYKGAAGFINLNICSPSNSTNCSDLAILKEDKAETALILKQDELVDIFGVLVESEGARTASGAVVQIHGPFKHFRIFKIRRVSETVNSSSENNLKSATTAPSILTIQKKLIELGYDPGKPDGLEGPKTKNAIIQYQKDKGLTPNGKIDEETIKSLNL